MTKLRISKSLFWGAAFIFAILMTFFYVYFSSLSKKSALNQSIEWNEHWTIQVNDHTESDQMLSAYHFSSLKKGDIITLSNFLPQCQISQPVLQIFLYLSACQVYLDDEEIYSYATEEEAWNTFVGSGYHFIHLPTNYRDKKLTIRLTISEDKAFSYLLIPKLFDDNYFYAFANSMKRSAVVGCLILGIGIILTLVSPFAICFSKEYTPLIYLGLFSFFVGSWTLCDNCVYQLFSANLRSVTFWEYFSLYCMPIPFLILLIYLLKDLTPFLRKLLYSLAGTLVFFVLTTTILHFLHIVHIPRTLVFFHALILLYCSAIIPVLIKGSPSMNHSIRIVFYGLVIEFAFVLLDVIRHNLYKMVFTNVKFLQTSILPYGTLIMIILIIISYLTSLFTAMTDRREKEQLIKQAYTDGLTRLYNRAKCKLIFDELDQTNESYTIFSFDVNGLKYINDTYGHSKGDQLIVACSKILLEVFQKAGDVIRMGGDEFVVVLRQNSKQQPEQLIQQLTKLLDTSEKRYGLNVSVSYGYVSSTEYEAEQTSAKHLYEIADERMYQMKKTSRLSRRNEISQSS